MAVKSLDREEGGTTMDKYVLEVIAKDGGSPQHKAVTMVTVFVDDVNDNVPEFEKDSYSKTIYNPTNSGNWNRNSTIE